MGWFLPMLSRPFSRRQRVHLVDRQKVHLVDRQKVHVVLAQVDSQRCTTLTTLARSRPMMQPTIQVRESPFITRTVPVAVGTTIQPTKQGTRSPMASKVACITIIPKASK